MFKNILKNLKEAALGVLPITVIIIAVNVILVGSYSVLPMSEMEFWSFITGAVLLIVGLTLYNFGCGTSIEFIGGLIGSEVSKTRKIPLILGICGALGAIVTVAEPDLSVLANQVNGISNAVLIGAVALGVGLFMIIAVARLVLKIDLKWVLLVFYGIVFVLAFVLQKEFVPLAFDSSGVTTGPVTVPLIIALGTSLSVAIGGNDSQDSSFGIVGVCSIGPVFAVMILSLFAKLDVGQTAESAGKFLTYKDVALEYLSNFPVYLKEMAIALLPIFVFFLIYNFVAFKLSFERLLKTVVGMLYVYVGLSLFLLGANVGFLPTGRSLGEALAGADSRLLIGVGVVIGALIVLAEPAVHVLTKQVEEVTGGVIKKSVMLAVLCVSMAISVGLSMLRIVYDIDLRYVLIVGYGIALGLMFVVPKIFTGIAFDSGGVASGAMTAAFLLPMASGATYAVYGADNPEIGRYIMTDAFGVVALVAMTPLVAIQLLGVAFKLKTQKISRTRVDEIAALLLAEGEVIELDDFDTAEDLVVAAKRTLEVKRVSGKIKNYVVSKDKKGKKEK